MTSINKIISYLIAIISLFVTASSIALAEEFEAVLAWSKRVELSTPVSGMVEKVFAKPGKIVNKGGILVSLDSRSFKADLKFAKAKLKNSKEHSLEAKRELDRQLDMYDRSMLSEHDLQTAKNNYTSAKSSYLQAQAALTKAKLNIENSKVRAPFNAIIISTSAVKGQVVASQVTPPILVTVAEAKKILARFYVVIDKVNNYVFNQSAKIKFSGKSYNGKIINIALEPEKSKAGFYAVDVAIDISDNLLRAGQKAIVDL